MTHNWHAIIGPNGMCECGVKADGTVIHCGEMLKTEREGDRRALQIALRRYGQHEVGCDCLYLETATCTCGFQDALNEKEN